MVVFVVVVVLVGGKSIEGILSVYVYVYMCICRSMVIWLYGYHRYVYMCGME